MILFFFFTDLHEVDKIVKTTNPTFEFLNITCCIGSDDGTQRTLEGRMRTNYELPLSRAVKYVLKTDEQFPLIYMSLDLAKSKDQLLLDLFEAIRAKKESTVVPDISTLPLEFVL